MAEKKRGILDDIMTKQDELQKSIAVVHQEDKRPRIDHGQPTFPILHTLLTDLRNKVHSMAIDSSKLEIEVRLGMLISHKRRWMGTSDRDTVHTLDDERKKALNVNFKAGVDEIMFEKLKKILISEGFKPEVQPPKRQRSNNMNKDRWEVDPTGKIQHNIETKAKLLRCDIALLSHHYDIRLDAAAEVPHTHVHGDSGFNPNVWHIERCKQRVSYLPPRRNAQEGEPFWKLDLTEVETTLHDTAEVSRDVEVELEMLSRPMCVWLNSADEGGRVTSAVASQLYHLIQLCLPSARDGGDAEADAARDPPLEPCVRDPAILKGIAKCNNDIRVALGGAVERSDDVGPFIGSMPINMSRRSLLDIQRHRFFLTEKSDGVRNLLYTVLDGTGTVQAVLMDRAKHLQKLHGSGVLGTALLPGMVLDGELVANRTCRRTVFLIFDVLAVDGVPLVQHNFERRFAALNEVVYPRVKGLGTGTGTGNSSVSSSGSSGGVGEALLTRLVPKAFFSKQQIGSLLSRVVWEKGHRVYRDPACPDQRHHKSDGIIFQPNSPYQISTDNRLMKWKWPELCTVDLQVGAMHNKDVLSLICRGPDGVDIDCTTRGRDNVGLGVFDGLRLAADRDDFSRASCIAEVAYSPEVGLWSYFQIRKDKTDPNFIHTVLGVLMEQAEAVSAEELEYRLLARNETENDFATQSANMKRKALEWQRQRVSK